MFFVTGKAMSPSSQPYTLHTPSIKPNMGTEMHKYSLSPSASYSGKVFLKCFIFLIISSDFAKRCLIGNVFFTNLNAQTPRWLSYVEKFVRLQSRKTP